MRWPRLVVLFMLAGVDPAHAAAWMRDAGSWQVISSLIYTDARHSFGNGSRAGTPTQFRRALLQTDTEYGWSDALSLFLRTESAFVHVRDAWNRSDAVSNAFEGGFRYHLGDNVLTEYDTLSVEAMARQAGAFNFSVSADGTAGGRAAGLRLLYGLPFKLAGLDGFANAEAGQRWLSAPRPDETVLDLTAGLWLTRRTMVMLQNFNVVSGPARRPYVRYRSHKLQLSYVWRWSPRFALQGGAYFSPAGANALQESGLVLSLWSNF